MIEITKAQLAQEVLQYLIDKGVVERKDMSEYSDEVLDIQDIFSKYWDEEEV